MTERNVGQDSQGDGQKDGEVLGQSATSRGGSPGLSGAGASTDRAASDASGAGGVEGTGDGPESEEELDALRGAEDRARSRSDEMGARGESV
jgi:hypothetical protein